MRPALATVSVLLLTMLAPLPQNAQPTPQQQQPTAPVAEPASIEGLVVKAATGEPLKKARVILRKMRARNQGAVAVTDLSGHFAFTDIEPGQYRLIVQRNGYVQQEYGQRRPTGPGTPLTLRPGQTLRDVAFWMIPSAVVTGRVYDEDGEPLPYVRVQLLRYRYVQGQRELVAAGNAVTNDLGEYRAFGLTPGQYYVSATLRPNLSLLFGGGGAAFRVAAVAALIGGGGRGGGGQRGARRAARAAGAGPTEEGYAPTYYPGTNDPSGASPLYLQPGDEIPSVDFTLLPTRTVRVSGRVINTVADATDGPTLAMLTPRGSRRLRIGRNRPAPVDSTTGAFEITGVLPGSYNLIAFAQSEGKRHTGLVPVEVGEGGLQNVTVNIGPGIKLEGRVTLDGNAVPAASSNTGSAPSPAGTGQQQSDQFTPRRLRVSLQAESNIPFGNSAGRVQEDGTFALENLIQESYQIRVNGLPPDYYLKSARLSGRDVLNQSLNLTAGSPGGQLELDVSSAGARIEGVVPDNDDKPFSGAQVVLVPDEKRRERQDLYKTTTTDQDGRFTLRGIAPGTYKLFAWEDMERGAYLDPDFLRPFERDGQEVRVQQSDQKSTQVKLIPAQGTRIR